MRDVGNCQRPNLSLRRRFFLALSDPNATVTILLSSAAESKVMAEQTTMKAVVFDGPRKVSIQDRPVPKCGFVPSSLSCSTVHLNN